MKSMRIIIAGLIIYAVCAGGICPSQAQDSKGKSELNLSRLEVVPDGNYLVNLQTEGKELLLNIKVQDNRAECVASTDSASKGIKGTFQRFAQAGSSAFLIRFQGNGSVGTQLWIFRKDGSAAVREAPDRGEQQNAIPVKGDGLTVPKK